MVPPFGELFSRNYGVFTVEEQESIRSSHILIIGCGGIGGYTALCLARSGVENFTLVEFDRYEPTNINRQIACFIDTIGQNKAEVIAGEINRINPQASLTICQEILSLDQIDPLILNADLVFPAADDFAYSQLCFRKAQKAGKPALYVMPSGLWAYVSILLPSHPFVEEFNGMPVFQTYQEIRDFYNSPTYRKNSTWYVRHAGWQPGYQKAFFHQQKPPAQICPVVWTASSIGALQVVKLLAGRQNYISYPRVCWIYDKSIRTVNLNYPNMPAFWRWSRKFYWLWLKLLHRV